MKASPLVVMALPLEAQGRFEALGISVLYTGVGKVNASHRLTRALAEARAADRRPLVVNFGTAGSRRFPTGTLVECRRFVQRDMDVRGLGFAEFETPFEHTPAEIEVPPLFGDLPHALCGSGDSFESTEAAPRFDVVDMEAYALAKVCLLEDVPFACAKYVTDGADTAAAGDWQSNLPRAADAFVALYRRLGERS